IPLTPGDKLSHELDVVADDVWALDIPSALIDNYKKLVAEAGALYQSHHYRDYHFLLTLSDNTISLGQEHHESSDDRVPERTLAPEHSQRSPDPLFRAFGVDIVSSWHGFLRRECADLAGS